MKRDEALRILREHRDELRRDYGVKSLALFGSVARDDATDTSDIDILVDFDGRVSLFDLIGLQLHLQELLDTPKVDVVMRDAIYPAIKDDILSEAIDVGPPSQLFRNANEDGRRSPPRPPCDQRVHPLHIRPMQRKWASCSTSGPLTFSEDLLYQPGATRCEGIVHELLQIKVPNLGQLFRALLRTYYLAA